jgi:hypothetical protein
MNFRPILSSSAACHFPNIPQIAGGFGLTLPPFRSPDKVYRR